MVWNGKENLFIAYLFDTENPICRSSNLVEFRFKFSSISRIIYFSSFNSNETEKVISKRRTVTKKRIDEKFSGLLMPVKGILEIFCSVLMIGFGAKEMVRGALGTTGGGLRMSCGG